MKKFLVLTLSGLLAIGMAGCGKVVQKEVAVASNQDQQEDDRCSAKTSKKVKLDKVNAVNITTTRDYKNLVDLYKNDSQRLDDKYMNRTLKVTGEISKYEKINNTIKVSLLAADHYKVIHAFFENTEENNEKITGLKIRGNASDKVQIGASLTVYGILANIEEDLGSYIPEITNCEFAE